MKNGLIFLVIALFCVPQLFAMDYSGNDSLNHQSKAQARLHAAEQHAAAQRLLVQKAQDHAQRAQKEKESAPQRVAILGDAFAQLPTTHNTRQDLSAIIASRMPPEVQRYIGEFHGKGNAGFIDQHLMELIPCVIRKHRFYPSMRKLMDLAINRLNDYAKVHMERQKALVEDQDQGQPYIIAVAGFWSFNDESSRFRYRAGVRDRATDLKQWFGLHYPNNQVKPLANDEWLAILYSNGSIKWQISVLAKARLKQLSKEQLVLLVDLWQSELLQPRHAQAYGLLPAHIKQAVQSNYTIAQSRLGQYVRTGLQWAAVMGSMLASAYTGYSFACNCFMGPEDYVFLVDKNKKIVGSKTFATGYKNRSQRTMLGGVLGMSLTTAFLAEPSLTGPLIRKLVTVEGRDSFEVSNRVTGGLIYLHAIALLAGSFWGFRQSLTIRYEQV